MKEIIRKNGWFIWPFVIIWLAGLIIQLLYEKNDIHLSLNAVHTEALDFFFTYYTNVGSWIPVVVIVLLLLFNSVKSGVLLAVAEVISSLITTILKHIFNMPRPVVYFKQFSESFPVVEGVDLHTTLSFPSGHTTACFALFFTLALLTKKPWLKFLCFIGAILGAYSRIYLSQHFLEDTLAGSLVATLTVILCATWFQHYNFGNKSVIGYIKAKKAKQ